MPRPDHHADGDAIAGFIGQAAKCAGIDTPAISVKPTKVAGLARAEHVRSGGARVVVGTNLTAGPKTVQRWAAFHEVGHVSLGHTDRPPPGHRVLIAALTILAPVSLAGLALAARGNFGLGLTVAIAAQLAYILVIYPLVLPASRQRELAADSHASSHGEPFTTEVAAFLATSEPRWARLKPGCYRTHPTSAQRLDAEMNRNTPPP